MTCNSAAPQLQVLSDCWGLHIFAPLMASRKLALKVLDLGSGSGRDCYLCSALVGEEGSVIGIDMTQEQLDVSLQRHLTSMLLKTRMLPGQCLHVAPWPWLCTRQDSSQQMKFALSLSLLEAPEMALMVESRVTLCKLLIAMESLTAIALRAFAGLNNVKMHL